MTYMICGDHRRGACSRGYCSYIHNENSSADQDSEMCREYQRGNCERAHCKFLHNSNPNANLEPRNSVKRMHEGVAWPGMYQQPMPILQPVFIPPSIPAQQQLPVSCGRAYCSYKHNVNPLADNEAPLCRKFDIGQPCRDDCRKMHNVNRNANPTAPICGDFKNLVSPHLSSMTSMSTHEQGYLPPAMMALVTPPQPRAASYSAHDLSLNPRNIHPSRLIAPPVSSLPQSYSPALFSYAVPPAMPYGGALAGFPSVSAVDKVNICGDFVRGNCDRPHCKYVHNINKYAEGATEICADFKAGRCTRDTCRFLHNTNDNAILPARPPSAKRFRPDN